jgi:hypothetical protein
MCMGTLVNLFRGPASMKIEYSFRRNYRSKI